MVQRKKSQESDSASEFPKKGVQAKGGHTKKERSIISSLCLSCCYRWSTSLQRRTTADGGTDKSRFPDPSRAVADKGKALTTDPQHPTERGLPLVQLSGDQRRSFRMSYFAFCREDPYVVSGSKRYRIDSLHEVDGVPRVLCWPSAMLFNNRAPRDSHALGLECLAPGSGLKRVDSLDLWHWPLGVIDRKTS
ncbi:D111/G-patch domain-containing protein [Striga asiatica]|uniref:D111/G-patch domain-containing protein n=1 Tax=Striga asiatica TaxID=4170 RepID=A0A5A7QTL8_STRAF|nr:D111/G-patch domain-containing protein [Striga asiatica]